jgi:hypothetical protein
MTKNYFELDKVSSITLTHEREITSYKWWAETPATQRTFLGIPIGTRPSIPAGWSNYEGGICRNPTSYFADYTWYRVDDVNKKIYNKAHVTIYLGYKHSLGQTFESTEEAQAYIDDLILGSDKKFTVIINK